MTELAPTDQLRLEAERLLTAQALDVVKAMQEGIDRATAELQRMHAILDRLVSGEGGR